MLCSYNADITALVSAELYKAKPRIRAANRGTVTKVRNVKANFILGATYMPNSYYDSKVKLILGKTHTDFSNNSDKRAEGDSSSSLDRKSTRLNSSHT